MRHYLPPPRTFVLGIARVVIILALLVQIVLPIGSGRALAAPLPQEASPPTDQPTDDEPFDEILPPVQPDEPGAELIPSLPAAVTLELAQPVVVFGDQVRLTIQVNSDFAEEIKEVTLALTLPPGIQTEKGERGELSWPLPSAPKQDPFRQQLLLAVDADAVGAEGGVLALAARLTAPGYLTSYWSTTVGIAADRGRGDVIIEQRQGAQGLVLQDGSGFLTLLADAKAMASTTTIRYTELYRWDKVAPLLDAATTEGVAGEEDASGEDALVSNNVVTATVALSPTVPVSSTEQRVNQLFLPLVESGAAPLTSAAALSTTKPSDLPPTRDENGVQLYYQWQFEAANDQETVQEFAEPLHLSLALAPLVAAGVDPTTLELWTRPSSDERWTLVRSDYDAKQERLTAFLPHFTQFGLGAGLSQNGEILPSTIGYTTDRLTGSASLQLPIEAPSGVGGLNPNLSFSYSSMASDDLFLDSNQDYLAQTSGVGMGWGVAGSNNFIVRTGGSLDNNTPDTYKSFSAVLNGMRVNIRYEEGAWRTDPETFYQVYWAGTDLFGTNAVVDWGGWTLIAPDGTKYEFGDNGTFAGFSSSSPTAVFMEQTNGNLTYRLAKQWYLRRVTDPLGNKIDYFYKGEQGFEQDCIQSSWPAINRWYTRAVYPTEIQWSGNVNTGLGNKLRVLFTYDAADRKDYKIQDWGEHDCKQVKFATKDRLLSVTVQADSGGWATLHKYELTQSNYPNDSSLTARLLLNSIKVRGKNNGILRTESYTYKYGDVVGYGPNRIWLESVDNGWGGKVTYQYISHRPECPNALCGLNTAHGWRAAVTRTIVEDGVGNKRFTDYWYGPPGDPNNEWGRIGLEDGGAQFFGFKETQATYYATAPASTLNTVVTPAAVIKWDKQESWPGAQDNPDPRAGKPKKLEVRSSSSGTVVAVTNYNWVAYRRVSGQWQATVKNHETNNNVTTFPIIWVRQESSDTWTAGGTWSGGNFLNGNGSGTQTRTLFDNTSAYRGYGNVLEVQEYSHSETTLDKATWDSRVSTNTSLTQLRKTLTDYFPGTDVKNAPARVLIYNGTTCMSEMRYIYDNVNGNYNSAPTAGILKKTEQANSSCSNTATIDQYNSLWNITRLATDSYGNVTTLNRVGTANDGSQNLVLLTTFDSTYNLFPIEQRYNSSTTYKETVSYYGVNGLTLADGKAAWGAIQQHCGVNEVCTRQSYDEYGRLVRRWEGVDTVSGWTDAAATLLRTYTAYGTSGWARNVVMEWRAPRCYGNFVRNVYDGLGQLLQEQRPQQNWTANADGCNPGTNAAEVDVNYLYDALGRQTKVSVPIATSASYINRAAVWNQGDSETIYDVAGRPARSYAPNEEQTEYGYSGRSTAVFALGRSGDPNKVVQWQETDGLGNLKRLRTYNKPYSEGGTAQATIDLVHDVLGNLRTVTHPGGIGTTTMNYDLAGRKISMVDPDLGSWSYVYNRQNQLVRQTDGRAKSICLYYDGFERLVGKHFPSTTTCPAAGGYAVTYGYDLNHGITLDTVVNRSRGLLTSVSNSGYSKTLFYNAAGLLRKETVIISGAPAYTTNYGYDSYLRPNTVTYPDNEVLTTIYNSMGLPRTLTSSTGGILVNGDTNNDGDTVDTYDGANYDAAGRLLQLHFPAGGNLWQTRAYYGWTTTDSTYAGDGNGRLDELRVGTTAGSSNRLLLAHDYDSFGNVKRIVENGAGNTFTYDDQNRVTAAYGKNYSYDTVGRMSSYEGTSQTVNNSFPLHAIKKSGYSYDANGNLVSRAGGQTLTWNHENQLSAISGGGLPTESYLYDDAGMRVKKTSAGVATYYVNQYYEVSGSTVTKYYYFGGQRIAMKKGTVLTYLHGDHLGSTVLETNTSGNGTADQKYFAYGRQRDTGPVVTDHKFTGQKLDGTGLQYYNARYYDPTIGAFISPDTIVPDATNVFSYNRYMYTLGNPLKYSDPTGHQTACTVERCAGGREAIVGASTLTSNVVVYVEPPAPQPSPTYMHAGDGCLYGCTNGVTLYYIKPGDVYGQSKVPIPVDTIPIPSIGIVDFDASSVIVHTTRGDTYVDQTVAGNISIVGYEYSFTGGSGAPTLNVGLPGDLLEASAQLWGGNGEVMVGSNGASMGIAGTLPQYRILATSGQYLTDIGGLENFGKLHVEGYQLQSMRITSGYNGYTGVNLLYSRIRNDQARSGFNWPEITDPPRMPSE